MHSAFVLLVIFMGSCLLILAGLGVGSIVTTARRRARHRALLATGVRDTATVVDNRVTDHPGSDNNNPAHVTYQAVVVLDHRDGAEPVVLPAAVRSSYAVGTKLEVVHDPANPGRVELIARPSVSGYVLGAMLLMFPVVFGSAMISAWLS